MRRFHSGEKSPANAPRAVPIAVVSITGLRGDETASDRLCSAPECSAPETDRSANNRRCEGSPRGTGFRAPRLHQSPFHEHLHGLAVSGSARQAGDMLTRLLGSCNVARAAARPTLATLTGECRGHMALTTQ